MRSHGVAKHQRAHVLSLEIVGHNQLKADFARDFGKKVFLHRDRALSGAFALRRSYRDVEDLLAERGLTVSNESIRRWVLKFGPIIAGNLRENRPKPYTRWHLDEMVVSIAGRQMYMWRAVDSEGEVLEPTRYSQPGDRSFGRVKTQSLLLLQAVFVKRAGRFAGHI
jgi:DDE domain